MTWFDRLQVEAVCLSSLLELLDEGDVVAFEQNLACSALAGNGKSRLLGSPMLRLSSGVSFFVFASVTSTASSMTRFMNSSKP
jgi:hypothetical protein